MKKLKRRQPRRSESGRNRKRRQKLSENAKSKKSRKKQLPWQLALQLRIMMKSCPLLQPKVMMMKSYLPKQTKSPMISV